MRYTIRALDASIWAAFAEREVSYRVELFDVVLSFRRATRRRLLEPRRASTGREQQSTMPGTGICGRSGSDRTCR
jgi:hypothetical protein